jgi:hypothetical protein
MDGQPPVSGFPGPSPQGAPAGAVGAGTQPGQPPFGSSPVQMPTPNRGLQAAALTQIQWAVRILEKALPVMGATSPVGKDLMSAIKALSKHIQPGDMGRGTEASTLQNMMMSAKAEQPQAQILKALQQQGQAGGMPAPPAQGAM